jgi:hypothetical protein
MAALKDLEVKAANAQNACLNAPVSETTWTRLGPEFGSDSGKVVIVARALWGLKSTGASFRNHLADQLREMGHVSCKANADVWLKPETRPRDGFQHCWCALCCVDDVTAAHHVKWHIVCIANQEVKFAHMVKQAKLHQSHHGPTSKFGILVPKNRKDALAIGAANGNKKWQKLMDVEINQIDERDTFNDLGKGRPPPRDHHKIRVHFVCDVRHDLRLKSRLLAEGNHAAPPKDSVCSGVVTLRSLHVCMLLAELNGIKVEAADVGNACLEACTKEKLCVVAGPKFGDQQGNVMVIVKALHGLRTSGARFHEKFADALLAMQFLLAKLIPMFG